MKIITYKRFCIQSRKLYVCHLQKCVERVFEVLFKILFRIEGHKLSNQIACQMSKMGEKIFSLQIETENEIFPSDQCAIVKRNIKLQYQQF